MENPLIVLDVETTGFKPEEGHEIVEIAAERFIEDNVLGVFHALIRPTKPLDLEAINVHGITNELLALEGKEAREIFPAFLDFVGSDVLVGHYIAFDLAFINQHLKLLGLSELSNRTIDTVSLARKYLILPSYRLEKVAQYLKVPQPEAHRALPDVRTTRAILLELFKRAKT